MTSTGKTPAVRKLRIFAFDPLLSTSIATSNFNEITVKVLWEALNPGPVGEYLEVIDIDPASNKLYDPINLDDYLVLAEDGHCPSEANPQFHQQMVYVVAMTTIRFFELALGRKLLWRRRYKNGASGDSYVQRLRIYPHALREANAYYSPDKVALLFGYFPASSDSFGDNLPGGTVFTCLSYDVVAHETTHAILDGLHRRYIEPSNPDVLAFHEAISDIVAIFQHFTQPAVLIDQLKRSHGQLEGARLLSQLAKQFGQALGRSEALRDALGTEPDPEDYLTVHEPHARGAILVAAIFDAFLRIYKERSADLFSFVPDSAQSLHPDLIKRLAYEASKAAKHVLLICIRALDYCPPVDITFGDYLRAIITSDKDQFPEDELHYRLAFVEAFRNRGIYPLDVMSLSEESLLWRPLPEASQQAFIGLFRDKDEPLKIKPLYSNSDSDREGLANAMIKSQRELHNWMQHHAKHNLEKINQALETTGIVLDPEKVPQTIDGKHGLPVFEVHSIRPAKRISEEKDIRTDFVVVITQQRRGYLDEDTQVAADANSEDNRQEDFTFRGGCTFIVDYDTAKVRYCIAKDITSSRRLAAYRNFIKNETSNPTFASTYFSSDISMQNREPIATLHRLVEEE